MREERIGASACCLLLMCLLHCESLWFQGSAQVYSSGILIRQTTQTAFNYLAEDGTRLILQVMVDDAVNTQTDVAVERLKRDLRSNNMNLEIYKPDPQRRDRISCSKMPPTRAPNFSVGWRRALPAPW